MGSPLNHEISKPVWNEGLWINAYSIRDPVVYLNMYPNGLVNWSPVSIPHFAKSPFNPQQVDVQIDTTSPGKGWSIGEHGAYWKNKKVAETLRNNLQ
jgi:hypothetical protein